MLAGHRELASGGEETSERGYRGGPEADPEGRGGVQCSDCTFHRESERLGGLYTGNLDRLEYDIDGDNMQHIHRSTLHRK